MKKIIFLLFLILIPLAMASSIQTNKQDYTRPENVNIDVTCTGNSVLQVYNAKTPVPDLVDIGSGSNTFSTIYNTASDSSDGKYLITLNCNDGTTAQINFCVNDDGCFVAPTTPTPAATNVTTPTPPPPTPSPQGKTYTINVTDAGFEPATLAIVEDDKVVWNVVEGLHIISSDEFPNSKLLSEEDTYSRIFTSDGTYDYKDLVREENTGQIIVLQKRKSEIEEVEIRNKLFKPEKVTIVAGDTVKWIHKDGLLPHSIVHADFNSTILAEGDTFTQTFEETGEFTYKNGIYPQNTGTVVVISLADYWKAKEQEKPKPAVCIPDVSCSQWSFCGADLQERRTCSDSNNCQPDKLETRPCLECKESWTCSAWSECINGLNTRTCTDEHFCGTTAQKPNLQKSCQAAAPPGPAPAQVEQPPPAFAPPTPPLIQEPAQVSLWQKYKIHIIAGSSGVVLIILTIILVLHFIKSKKMAFNIDELKEWIKKERAIGSSDFDIKALLAHHTGWKEEEVLHAFEALKGGAETPAATQPPASAQPTE